MKRAILVMVAAMVFAVAAPQVWAANAGDDIYFSTSSSNPGLTVGNLSGLSYTAGSSNTLFVWITTASGSADDVTPVLTNNLGIDANSGLANSAAGLAVNYSVFADSLGIGNNLKLTAASDVNPTVSGTTTRWEDVSSFSGLSATTIPDVNAVTKPALAAGGSAGSFTGTGVFRGISQQNSDTSSIAGSFSNGAGKAFLLGSVTFTAPTAGTATLAIQPSTKKIIQGIVGGATSLDMTNFFAYHTADLTITAATPTVISGDTYTPDPAHPGQFIPPDGVVGLQDLNNVFNNFGASGPYPPLSGDTFTPDPAHPGSLLPPDGIVGLQDLNNVFNNFGAHAAPPLGGAVPEPTSICLLAMGAFGFLGVRRFGSKRK